MRYKKTIKTIFYIFFDLFFVDDALFVEETNSVVYVNNYNSLLFFEIPSSPKERFKANFDWLHSPEKLDKLPQIDEHIS